MGTETNWPSISARYTTIEEGISRGTIRAPFESGYEQTRGKWSRTRRSFVLSWDRLSEANFNTLVGFFGTSVQAGVTSFVWTHPSGSTYEVRFMDDELMMTSTVSGYYSGSVRLRQV